LGNRCAAPGALWQTSARHSSWTVRLLRKLQQDQMIIEHFYIFCVYFIALPLHCLVYLSRINSFMTILGMIELVNAGINLYLERLRILAASVNFWRCIKKSVYNFSYLTFHICRVRSRTLISRQIQSSKARGYSFVSELLIYV
jgi:hypothetical protein